MRHIYFKKSKKKYPRGAGASARVAPFENQSGFSLVELLIALTLTAFFATSLLTVISTGGEAFQMIMDEKTAQSEARIAVSYVTVKLRRRSSQGAVSIVASDSPTNGRNVLKIDNESALGESYYIYFEEARDGETAGRLVEKTASAPHVGDREGAYKIADIADFYIAYANEEQTAIDIFVSCDAPNGRITRSVSITLRS